MGLTLSGPKETDSRKKHFGPKKKPQKWYFRCGIRRPGRAGAGRFGVRFFRHNFGNRRASRGGTTRKLGFFSWAPRFRVLFLGGEILVLGTKPLGVQKKQKPIFLLSAHDNSI